MQVIDVGDLAAWIVAAGMSGVTGIVTAVGESHAFDNFLSGVSDVVGFTGELVTVDDAWLIEHDVHYWAGSLSLALWLSVPFTSLCEAEQRRIPRCRGHHPSAPRHNFTRA